MCAFHVGQKQNHVYVQRLDSLLKHVLYLSLSRIFIYERFLVNFAYNGSHPIRKSSTKIYA